MPRPALELADIFRRYGEDFRQAHALSRDQLRLMRAIETCRTPVLGGHVEKCGLCPYTRISYNSCRNRHCPKCQSLARARWLENRKADLLPVEYFHVVFTVPKQVAALALQNKKVVYNILFQSASETLLTIAGDPRRLGAGIGLFAILHTWGQNLHHHPHLHCVVPGGGLSPDHQSWIACKPGFFLPVRVLSGLFRRLFLQALQKAFHHHQLQFFGALTPLTDPAAFARYLDPLGKTDWVVYAKPPFGGPNQVLEYLGRYTHRVAISNQRLLSLDSRGVTFQWTDYRHASRHRTMTLAVENFIRRFLLHTLPPGFQRIRYYGLLSNRHRAQSLTIARRLLATPTSDLLPRPAADFRDLYQQLTGLSLRRCPRCGIGILSVAEILTPLRFLQSLPVPIDSS